MWSKILISQFIILLVLLGISNVAFAEVFYQNPIVIEHTNILNITDATIPGIDQIQVWIEYIPGLPGDKISVNLDRIDNSDNFRSEFVKFTSGMTDYSVDQLHVDIGADVVLVRYGITEWYASVITNNPTLGPLPLPISPSVLLGRSNTNCSTYGGDSDNDFICNSWETSTGLAINYPSGANYTLPCIVGSSYVDDPLGTSVCPSTSVKDLYIEIDYMVGHKPDLDALKNVVTAFRSAPVNKINLHVFLSDTPLDHRTSLLFPGGITEGFLNLKAMEFGTQSEQTTNWLPNNVPVNYAAKFQVFQYFLWGHDAIVSGAPSGSPSPSGISDSANDGAVTLGSFSATVAGSRKQQEGTFMHELGHNLGLNHGGIKNDQNNCKPNLLSVMNYAYQFGDLTPNQLDYSRKAIGANVTGSTSLGSESLLAGVAMSVSDSSPSNQYMVYGNGSGQVLSQQLPEILSEGHVWPLNWTYIRTLTDSQGNIFCSPTNPPGQQTPPIQLTGVDQWKSITLAHSNSNWAQGRITGYVLVDAKSSPEKHVPDFIIPKDTTCISLEDAQIQSDLYNLNIDDAPICFTEITNDNVRAARSIHIDNIIAIIKPLDATFFKNLSTRDTLIDAAEDIRTLVLADKIYETIDGYTNFKKLIDTEITDVSTQDTLLYLVDVSTYTLNPVGEPPLPPVDGSSKCVNTDEDGVPCTIDLCPNTPVGDQVNESGCTVRISLSTHYIWIISVIVITVIGIIIAYFESRSDRIIV